MCTCIYIYRYMYICRYAESQGSSEVLQPVRCSQCVAASVLQPVCCSHIMCVLHDTWRDTITSHKKCTTHFVMCVLRYTWRDTIISHMTCTAHFVMCVLHYTWRDRIISHLKCTTHFVMCVLHYTQRDTHMKSSRKVCKYSRVYTLQV